MKICAEKLTKDYFRKAGEANHFYAVREAELTLEPGSVTVVMGRSGSGKSTLLHMLSGLLVPTQGRITADGEDLYAMPDRALALFRNRHFGVIPQGHTAVSTLSVRENVLLPALLGGREEEYREQAEKRLEQFAIAPLADELPRTLSGGELKRIAVARALLPDPEVIFADEPTGDLDDENCSLVLSALRAEADRGAAVLLVTHEDEAERIADRVLRMNAGILETK